MQMAALAILSLAIVVAVYAQDEKNLTDCSGGQAHLFGWGVLFNGTHHIEQTEGSSVVERWCYTFYHQPTSDSRADGACSGHPSEQTALLQSIGAQFESCFRNPEGGMQLAIGTITPSPNYTGLDPDANMFTGDYWTHPSLLLPTPERNLTICADMSAKWPLASNSFKYLIKTPRKFVIGNLPGPACDDRHQSTISTGMPSSTIPVLSLSSEILGESPVTNTFVRSAGLGGYNITDGVQTTLVPSAIQPAPLAASSYSQSHLEIESLVSRQQMPIFRHDVSIGESSGTGSLSAFAIAGLSAAFACVILLLVGGIILRRRYLAATDHCKLEGEKSLA